MTDDFSGSLEEFRELFPFAQLHVRLLPVRSLAGKSPLALHLAVRDGRAHLVDFRPEQRLDRALDFRLVGVDRRMKDDGAAVLLAQNRRLLGDERAADHIGESHKNVLSYQFSVFSERPCSFSTAALVAITRVAFITSRATTRELATSCTPGRLRTAMPRFSFGCTSMSSAFPPAPRLLSSSVGVLVRASLAASASTTTSDPS